MKNIRLKKEWLNRKDNEDCEIKQWGQFKDDFHLYCSLCACAISVRQKGFQAIKQHYSYNKHIDNYRTKFDINQTSLQSGSISTFTSQATERTLTIASRKDSSFRAELIYAMGVIKRNHSISSCAGIVDEWHSMFPGILPKQLSLSPTKLSYLITHALSPYFRKALLEDVKYSYYSILYDETTNNEGKKELQTVVRYWSPKKREIVTSHLETFFIGHATGDILCENIMSAINNADLPLENLVMIGSDGPNVNKKVFRLLNDEVRKIRDHNVLDVGTCNIHIIHNAFHKGLEAFKTNASDFLIYAFNFFHNWPSHLDDFQEIQKDLKLPCNRLIRYVPNRWLSLESAANRMLEQWHAVYNYFVKYIPTKQKKLNTNFYYKKVVECLKNPMMQAELSFLSSTAAIFAKTTLKFQSNAPLIHTLYSDLKELVLTLANRTIRSSLLCSNNPSLDDLQDILVQNNSEDFVAYKNVQCGDEAKKVLSTLPIALQETFRSNCLDFYKESCLHILRKSSLKNNLSLKYYRFLKPEQRCKIISIADIQTISKLLPFNIREDLLHDEWKCLMAYQLETDHQSTRIDHYWRGIFDSSIGFRLENITKVVKTVLAISHGNADVERGFSLSGRILTEDRASMSLRVLNAILCVKDGLNLYQGKPAAVPITNELLSYAYSAALKYKEYLEEKRRQKEEDDALVKKKEEERLTIAKQMDEVRQKKEKFIELSSKLDKIEEEEKEDRTVADKLIEEAQERLMSGIKK